MAKRIFIITARGRANKAAEVEQILREYDYDVVNPTVIEEYEKEKVRLGLFDENFGWLKRDIRKMLDCDGVCAFDDFVDNDYENGLVTLAMSLPMFSHKGVAYLREWIEDTDG